MALKEWRAQGPDEESPGEGERGSRKTSDGVGERKKKWGEEREVEEEREGGAGRIKGEEK